MTQMKGTGLYGVGFPEDLTSKLHQQETQLISPVGFSLTTYSTLWENGKNNDKDTKDYSMQTCRGAF